MVESFLDVKKRVQGFTQEEQDWGVPDDIYESIERCSLELEDLYEIQLERLLVNRSEIGEFLKGD